MSETITLTKKNFIIGVVFLSLVLAITIFATIFLSTKAEARMMALTYRDIICLGDCSSPIWTCPTKSGSCTAGDIACDEDLSTIHACEYKCQPNGTWSGANECDTNMCYANKCDQGSIY